ncbi:hypothetical protein JB92DRAFT_2826420 [Gautieria morchelliformis]|nr:hypothetical protein JB92DRAFT_2826420 [Gautieria morchelliformis]
MSEEIASDEEVSEDDTSDGEYGVGVTTRTGPSRRTQAFQPAPSTDGRVHKPQKNAGGSKARRRATVTLNPSILQRVRAEYAESLSLLTPRNPFRGANPNAFPPDHQLACDATKTILVSQVHVDLGLATHLLERKPACVYRTTTSYEASNNRLDSVSYNEADDGVDSDSDATTTMGLE